MIRLIWYILNVLVMQLRLCHILHHPMAEIFFMVVEMSNGTCYSLAIPHLALFHKVLDDFSVIHENVNMTYGPWSE